MPNCGMAERLRSLGFLRVHRAMLFVLGVAICVTRRIDRIRSRNRRTAIKSRRIRTISLDMRLMVQPKRKIVFAGI